MTRADEPRARRGDLVRAAVACAVLVLLSWLDRDGCVAANHSAVFGLVVSWIIGAAEAIGSAAAWVGVHAEAVIVFLIQHVDWLTSHVASILKSTGAMFARVWDGLRAVYNDVLKPFAQWLDDVYQRIKSWIAKFVKPVYDFLHDVRDKILGLYKTFVRPVLDVIDFARGALKVLADLGVQWARALDARLGTIESVITENFQKFLGDLNKVIGIVNGVITGDLLFQRFPFLMTMKRDIAPIGRILTNVRAAKISGDQEYTITRSAETASQQAVIDDTIAMFEGGDSEGVAPLVAQAGAEWEELLGLDPPANAQRAA